MDVALDARSRMTGLARKCAAVVLLVTACRARGAATSDASSPAAAEASKIDTTLQEEEKVDPTPPSSAEPFQPSEFERRAMQRIRWLGRRDHVVFESGPIESADLDLSASFPWDGQNDDERTEGPGQVAGYRLDDEACILHAVVPGYWFEHPEVVIELGQHDGAWEVRRFAVWMSSDLVVLEPDGEVLVRWCRTLRGSIRVDGDATKSEAAVRCRFRLQAGDDLSEIREARGAFEVRPEWNVEKLPLVVRRYIRDTSDFER